MDSNNERRKFPRLDICVKIMHKVLTDLELKKFSNFGHYVNEAKSNNISMEGISIHTEEELPRDSIIALEMIFPQESQSVRGLGRVIWSLPSSKASGYDAGVEFIAMSDKHVDSMANLVSEYLINKYKIEESGDRKNLKEIFMHFFRRKK